MSDLFYSKSGVLTTYFYDDEYGGGYSESAVMNGICSAAVRKSGEVTCGGGKIYIEGSNPCAPMLALDGDIINSRTVRRQAVTVDGTEYTVKNFRKIYYGGTVHHCEIELS